jgi:hypothetical protein
LDEPKVSVRAAERERKGKAEERAREGSTTPESTRRSVDTCGRRRAIPPPPVDVVAGEERGIREEGLGYL